MNFFDEIDNFDESLITLFPGQGSSSSSKPCYYEPWFCDPGWEPRPSSSSSSGKPVWARPPLLGQICQSGNPNINTCAAYNTLVVEKIYVKECGSNTMLSCSEPIKIMVGVLFKRLSLPDLPPLGQTRIPLEIRQIGGGCSNSGCLPFHLKSYYSPIDLPYWEKGSSPSYAYAIFPIYFYLDNVIPKTNQAVTYEYSFYTSGYGGGGGATQNCGIKITIPAGSCCTSNPDLQYLCDSNKRKNQSINFNSQSRDYSL